MLLADLVGDYFMGRYMGIILPRELPVNLLL